MKAEITKTKYKGIPIVTIYPYGELPMELVEQMDKDVKEADLLLQLQTVDLKPIKDLIDLLLEKDAVIVSIRRYPDKERQDITMINVKGISRDKFQSESKGDIYL